MGFILKFLSVRLIVLSATKIGFVEKYSQNFSNVIISEEFKSYLLHILLKIVTKYLVTRASDPVSTDWSLTEIQSYVVEGLF